MERDSREKQLMYLTDLATQFQRLVVLSIDAKYGSDAAFDNSTMRLATLVSERNAMFSDELAKNGQEYRFTSQDMSFDESEQDLPPPLTWTALEPPGIESGATFQVRKFDDISGLEELLLNQEMPLTSNGKSIAHWLRAVYESSRGFELGTFDSSILGATMKVQSTKWTALALGYISDVVTIVHRFITQILDLICPDLQVKTELLSVLNDGLFERYKRAIDQVHFLLRVERNGTPMTLNHYFNDNLEKW